MEGRFHFYEGYSLQQVTLPVRVMKAWGAELMIVSNACGGMNPYYRCGDLMVIDDHINLMGGNPLIGFNDDRLGPWFPDMSEPYDAKLIDLAEILLRMLHMPLHRGVFVAVSGPNLETRAEYRFLRHRCRCCGNVHCARGDCRSALWPSCSWSVHHHGHVLSGYPTAGEC